MAFWIVLLIILALLFGGFGLAVGALRILLWIGLVLLVFALVSHFMRY